MRGVPPAESDTTRLKNAVYAALVIVGLVLAASGPAESAYPGSNGRIAFETTRDGNLEIYSMNADGSDQRNLTNDPAEDTDPVWSPDGSRIAFVKASEGAPQHLGDERRRHRSDQPHARTGDHRPGQRGH